MLFYKIKSLFISTWRRFLCSSFQLAFVTLLLTFMTGIFAWGGFNWAMELTNNEAFCISCHEMKENVFVEYKNTVHYLNRTGVRATCPDCHVPKEWQHMVVRKISASSELLQKVLGSIDTREKFLAKRPKLVRKVWAAMKQTNSRECRNCHSFAYMDSAKQTSGSGKIHLDAKEKGMTCIDCHMGIAHELPKALLEKEHVRFEQDGVACRNCHTDMAQASVEEEWEWDLDLE